MNSRENTSVQKLDQQVKLILFLRRKLVLFSLQCSKITCRIIQLQNSPPKKKEMPIFSKTQAFLLKKRKNELFLNGLIRSSHIHFWTKMKKRSLPLNSSRILIFKTPNHHVSNQNLCYLPLNWLVNHRILILAHYNPYITG